MRITGLDHIVLVTPDQERSLEWYSGTLGLATERADEWRRGEAPFPSVRIDPTTIIDLFRGVLDGTNLDHFCLVMAEPDWDEMVAAGAIPVERGPSRVFGAQGMGLSIYTRDPDGNVVELRKYASGGDEAGQRVH
ncbi:MAG TPA: VOC family protein [Acidimicrobiales bacterium]|jgi:catechol 2,3-dioxygenase-like lactoylglutathione lyase family enzyme|nr:VOC family protein [Acidimicrobiales bacterium]